MRDEKYNFNSGRRPSIDDPVSFYGPSGHYYFVARLANCARDIYSPEMNLDREAYSARHIHSGAS